ncbi:MAG: panB [Thermoleophilia bacterium]|nr:panB [Thermoleophilia bacterium]
MTDTPTPPERVHPANLRDVVASGRRLVMVTAYDHPSARLADEAGIDLLLVGDSAAMVVLGRESTNDVTMEEMLLFTRAVSRGARRAMVVGDLPFMSYQPSDELAVVNAGRLVGEGGAHAVKLEGGGRAVDRARAIAEAGIAVVGHLGLTPQSAPALGGFRAQARTAAAAARLLEDALALEAAGAVAIVLEAIPAEVAERVTSRLAVPTIGIGAGPGTSGQVLVWHDMLGLTERVPRFVHRFGDLTAPTVDALRSYAAAVRDGSFPTAEHTYAMPDDEAGQFAAEAASAPQLRSVR